MVELSPICLVAPKAVISLLVYFTTNLGTDAFELPFREWSVKFQISKQFSPFKSNYNTTSFFVFILQRLPFNWKNPFGYLAAITLQYALTRCFFIYVGSFASFSVGAFLFSWAMSKDVKCSLNPINRKRNARKRTPKIFWQLTKFIQIHSDSKR